MIILIELENIMLALKYAIFLRKFFTFDSATTLQTRNLTKFLSYFFTISLFFCDSTIFKNFPINKKWKTPI